MAHRVVVLGGGTGGTLTANRLRRLYSEAEAVITVVDQDDRHVYQPGLLFVPFGLASAEHIVRPRSRQLHTGIAYVKSAIDHVDLLTSEVTLENGTTLGYDVLVVATGAVLVPEETAGLTSGGWTDKVHTFYSLEGAAALAPALASFDGGHLVVNVVDMPIKCPVAPLEFCFLADWYFHERGIRDQVQLTYVTPLDGAFTKPVGLCPPRGNAGRQGHRPRDRVQHRGGRRVGWTPHRLRRACGRISTWRWWCRSMEELAMSAGRPAWVTNSISSPPTSTPSNPRRRPNVFVIGDAANVPASKAGSVTHFEGEVLVENIRCFLAGEPLDQSFDGHTNCFIETGFHKALLIDFNYDTEPLPGHYPSGVGLPSAGGVPAQPPRQAHVPVVLLARLVARTRHSRASVRPCPPPERIARRRGRTEKGLTHVDC